MVFVAPKIIGGVHAPTPVGDLGFVEMTQAVGITHAQWEASGSDMMLTGYLSSTVPSLAALDEALDSMLAVREARAEKGGHASTSGGDPVQPPRRGGKATVSAASTVPPPLPQELSRGEVLSFDRLEARNVV